MGDGLNNRVKTFRLIPISVDGAVHVLDFGASVMDLKKLWIGTTGEPLRRYSFWSQEKLSWGQYKVPDVRVGDVIHVGIKGDAWAKRLKFVLEDFDDRWLIVKPIEENLHGENIDDSKPEGPGLDGIHGAERDPEVYRREVRTVGNGDEAGE